MQLSFGANHLFFSWCFLIGSRTLDSALSKSTQNVGQEPLAGRRNGYLSHTMTGILRKSWANDHMMDTQWTSKPSTGHIIVCKDPSVCVHIYITYCNTLYRVGSISGPGPRARAGMGPVGGPAWSPQSPRARASMGSPRGPAEPASPQSPQGPQGLIYFVQLRSKYFVEIQRVVGRRLRTTTLYCSMLLQNTTAY